MQDHRPDTALSPSMKSFYERLIEEGIDSRRARRSDITKRVNKHRGGVSRSVDNQQRRAKRKAQAAARRVNR